MGMFDSILPSILVPYPGPSEDIRVQDLFLYLRPETNGVETESNVLRVIQQSPTYKEHMKLIYLANIPGEFIEKNHIIEAHYRARLNFAVKGKRCFTPFMKRRFKQYFHVSFEKSKVVGAFEALRLLNMDVEELFSIWVPEEDMTIIHEQSIKRYKDLYIVNYDIPALLHKNNKMTDIAVMIFRTPFSYSELRDILEEMETCLIDSGVLKQGAPLSRVIHYSKGPFEQILDGTGYLYQKDGTLVKFQDISFARILIDSGYTEKNIRAILNHPIACFKKEDGKILEDNIFSFTVNDNYETALKKIQTMSSQFLY